MRARPDDLESLVVALRRIHPATIPEDAADYRARGWTAEHYTVLADQVEHAVRHDRQITAWRTPANPSGRRSAAEVADVLESLWEHLVDPATHGGTDPSIVLAWLGLAVTAPTTSTYRRVRRMLVGPTPFEVEQWLTWRTLGPIGALAFAAGLGLAEAQTWIREHGGTPAEAAHANTGDLRALAALRGWPQPNWAAPARSPRLR